MFYFIYRIVPAKLFSEHGSALILLKFKHDSTIKGLYVQLERYLRLHDLSLYTAFFFRRRVTPPVLRLYKNFVHRRCHPIFSLCISLLNKNMAFKKKGTNNYLYSSVKLKYFVWTSAKESIFMIDFSSQGLQKLKIKKWYLLLEKMK